MRIAAVLSELDASEAKEIEREFRDSGHDWARVPRSCLVAWGFMRLLREAKEDMDRGD